MITPEGVKRIIAKITGQPALEMPTSFSASVPPQKNLDDQGKKIGQESITTPAGTFLCDHYQVPEGDVWVAASVSPYGIVKMTGPGMTMVLQKVVSGATTQIQETPQKISMPTMDNASHQ